MFCVFCSHFFGNNLNMFLLWKLCEKLDYYNSIIDWCLKVSGHQVIVTSYETSDQVEGIIEAFKQQTKNYESKIYLYHFL